MSTPSDAGYDRAGYPVSEDRSSASIGELFADVSRDLTLLLRQEVELAKAEVRESAARAGTGAGLLGGAGFAAYLAVLFGSIAAWWALGGITGRGWSALLVAVIWAVAAAALAAAGRQRLRAVRGVPRTVDTVKKIPDAVKGDEEAAR